MKNVLMMSHQMKIRKMNLNSLKNLNSLMNLSFWIHNLKIRHCRMICHYMKTRRNKMIRSQRFFWMVQNSFLNLICFHLKGQNNC